MTLQREDVATETLVAEYATGVSLSQLGQRHAMSPGGVRGRLVSAGVEIRSSKANSGARNGRWSETPTANAGRLRANAQFREPQPCERCDSTDQPHRHHRDGDPTHNAPENIGWLCASCHTKLHREVERAEARGIFRAIAHVDEWVRRFEAGETARQIADSSAFSYNTVVRWLQERGVFVPYRPGVFDNRPGSLTTSEVGEIRLLIGQGVKQRDIAKRYGVSEGHVSQLKSGARR